MGEDRDIEALTEFNMAMAWETEQKKLSLPVAAKGVQKVLENPRHGFYLAAEVANEVVGSLMVTFEWSDWRCAVFWWIQSVYVKPEFRKQGIFKHLYEYLKDKASQEPNVCGFRLYVEQSNRIAQSTYGKVGMKDTRYRVYEELFLK
ncbi:MAG: GNAT family N-acetyltransferase [Planctomycetota bacterium]|jgi:ribosomal protein S18 acetylase RimI-like enzyme